MIGNISFGGVHVLVEKDGVILQHPGREDRRLAASSRRQARPQRRQGYAEQRLLREVGHALALPR